LELARASSEDPDAIIETDSATLSAVLWHGRQLTDARRAGAIEIDGSNAAVERFLRLFPPPEPGLSPGPLTGLAEELVALLQESSIRTKIGSTGDDDLLALDALESVGEHRAIDLGEHVTPHLHHMVGPDPDDVRVEGGVVQLAEGKPVGHDSSSLWMAVRQDVGCVEELRVLSQTTDGASHAVGLKHSRPKTGLVHAFLYQPDRIATKAGVRGPEERPCPETLDVVGANGEG
jgi:hypothetical protein